MSSTTLLRFEQKEITGFDKQTLVPATEFIGVDMDKLGDGNLSFSLYGWGRVDLADRSTNEGYTNGDLAYAYLRYRIPKANGVIKAGRFQVNEGVAIEQIDGVSARADLLKGFTFSLFGGAPVKLDMTDDNKGDYIYGGRVAWRWAGILEVGGSGLQEGHVIIDPATGKKENRDMVGGDIWLSPHRMIELNGHTFYNIGRDEIAEHSYLLTVTPHKKVAISGTYNKQNFESFFAYTNLPSLFNPNTNGKMESYGGNITVTPIPPLVLTADYRHYDRTSDVTTDYNGTSDRYGIEARLTFLDRKVRSGLSFHRSDGASGFNSYNEVRGYGLYDSGRYVVSADAIGQFYHTSISSRKEAYEVIASGGFRILPELLLSGDISYGRNPQFDDEVRGVLRLSYENKWTHSDKGAQK